jgi:hypothetical protein
MNTAALSVGQFQWQSRISSPIVEVAVWLATSAWGGTSGVGGRNIELQQRVRCMGSTRVRRIVFIGVANVSKFGWIVENWDVFVLLPYLASCPLTPFGPLSTSSSSDSSESNCRTKFISF